MSTEHSFTVSDTNCRRCFHALIVILLLLLHSQIMAIPPDQERRWGEMSILSFGLTEISGSATETLKDGWAVGVPEVHLAVLPWIKGFRIGIGFWEGGTNVFRLNEEEKLAMQEYEYVTTTNGHVTEREAVDKVYCDLSRISGSLKWYPINNGLGLFSGNFRIRPYVTSGFAFHRITTTTDGGDKAWGNGTFANYGVDFGFAPDRRGVEKFFVRLEVVEGVIPDWNVRVLPELRPVRGGRYRLVRFGVGLIDLDASIF
ncbi:hypothetical protein ACFL45_04535 [Candidatus Neomarinimicrobiota bacterium]